MSSIILQELSKQLISLHKNEESSISWHDCYLTVMCEKGLLLFELSHNVKSLDKTHKFIQYLINHPKTSPVTNLTTNKVLNKNLPNIHQVEMITDHSLWPHNPSLLQEMAAIVDFKWSPVGVKDNHESVIAVLTNVGVVEIHVKKNHKWVCSIQISELLTEETNGYLNIPESFEELRTKVHSLATSAMCWSPLNQDLTSYFVTAQKNGDIIIWQVDYNNKISAKVVAMIQVESVEIHCLQWIPVTMDKFFLVASNIIGQIKIFEFHFLNELIELVQTHTLWAHKDNMLSKFLEFKDYNSNIVLVCNKNRHLLIFLFDKECNVLGQYINNINDHRITSIVNVEDDIFITTVNGKIYKLNLSMQDKILNVALDSIEFNNLSPTHELYGIAFSKNKVLIFLCALDRKAIIKKKSSFLEIIITSTKDKIDSLPMLLLENPSKNLNMYWDVIETLRCLCYKARKLPDVNFDEIYSQAINDIYKLKVYYIFCVIFDNLKRMFRISSDIHLPEGNPEIVKEEILVAQADKVLCGLSKKFKTEGELTSQEKNYCIGAKSFLEYIFIKNKKNLAEVMDQSILDISTENSMFTCQGCDEKLTGFKCKNDHLNMYCALTFTPIETDNYLACQWCFLTANPELSVDNPSCLFCDAPLLNIDDIY